ncbi:hypothetical protein KKE92_02685 [Candidatus Micrarchaeota archaeon]|nr:hypothetical protein [Candidatus Micrarchaeota archaeon]
MAPRIINVNGIGIDLQKLRLDNQIKLMAAQAIQDGSINRFFGEILESNLMKAPKERRAEIASAVCVVALELGQREFALRHAPDIDSVDRSSLDILVESAKKLCCTESEVELISLLSTTPLTARGQLYARPGQLLRIDFSDGKKAFCKSRNARQEETGYKLLEISGLPSCRSECIDDWIVIAGAPGRGVFDHFVLPLSDTPDTKQEYTEIFKRIIAITAFDYVFGMLDRNEGGIVFGKNTPVTAVDHEYLFSYYPIPAQGRNMFNQRIYLRQLGLDEELFRDDRAIDKHLEYASDFFEQAEKNRLIIADVFSEHVARVHFVDCTIFDVELSPETIGIIASRISGGVVGFRNTMLDEMKITRELGMFQCPE